MKRLTRIAAWMGMMCIAMDPPCAAQSPIDRPVISPYLQLLRPQQGPLPNYQNFVVPRLEMERLHFRQTEFERQFDQQIAQQNDAMQAMAAGGARPTGGAGPASFLNFLHFYPQAAGAAAVRRRF
jgi:hypothetical protein